MYTVRTKHGRLRDDANISPASEAASVIGAKPTPTHVSIEPMNARTSSCGHHRRAGDLRADLPRREGEDDAEWRVDGVIDAMAAEVCEPRRPT